MKYKLFLILFFPCLLFSQTLKKDSLFIDGKLIGRINVFTSTKTVSSVEEVQGINNSIVPQISNPEQKIEVSHYIVSIDEFLTKEENKRVEQYFFNLGHKISVKSDGRCGMTYIIVERFYGKTNAQVAGYYLKEAGKLKNCSNNWAIVGGVASSLLITVLPKSIPTLVLGVGVGLFTGITAISKDYESNRLLQKSGKFLMKQ